MELSKKIRQLLVIVILLLPYNELFSKSSVRFQNLNKKYGISIRDANEICRGDDGFIWASSRFGIMRFSMDDYRIYTLPYESSDVITVNLASKNSLLYAYTNNGQIFIYNQISDRFELLINLYEKLNDSKLTVSRIIIDQHNRLWISTSVGLYNFSNNKLKKAIGGDNITYLCWYDENQCFYATDKGISVFNILTWNSQIIYDRPVCENYTVSKLFYDEQEDEIWVGTVSAGLFVLKVRGETLYKKVVEGIPKQPILAIETNTDSTILAGIDGQGIWEICKRDGKVLNTYKEDINDINSLKGNGIYDLYRDENNRIWVCSIGGGVSFFDQENDLIQNIKHVTNNPNSLIDNDVKYILVDRDDNIWFATNNGISFWNRTTNNWQSFYHNEKDHAQVFLSLCEDNEGNIWAGSYSSGIYILDRETGNELKHLSAWQPNYECNFIFDLYKDSEGDIWIGDVKGNSGYFCSNTSDFVPLNDQSINALAEHKNGQMILGTSFGVSLYDKRTGTIQKLLNGYLVSDLCILNNTIWISTIGDGVIQYNIDTKNTRKYKVKDGLPSNFVNSIYYKDAFFWFGTENGLCRLNPLDNSILTIEHFGESSVSFNYKSVDTLENGRMIWGTNDGAYIFNSDITENDRTGGQIFFQELAVSGRSIRDTSFFNLTSPLDSLSVLTLNYNQNTISLELLPIGVSLPFSKFSWKLEENDPKWSPVSANRIITYTNIPSGEYMLKIRMYDNSARRILDERSIVLNIIPPFWETWWFRTLMVVFVFSVVIFLISYYVDKLKKQHSEEKIRFFTNTAHDIRTSLTLINAPIEELNKENNLSEFGIQCLNTATEQVQKLSSVVNQLMDFQKADIGKERMKLSMSDVVEVVRGRVLMFESYAKKQGIKLIFNTNQSGYMTAIDENIIEKVIDNLISNAIKYSQAPGEVEISLECSPKKWILDVRDYGLGISKKAQKQLFKEFYRANNVINSRIVGSGIGLLLVKIYVNMHSGTVSCISKKKVGSTFRVEIPYKSSTKNPVKKVNHNFTLTADINTTNKPVEREAIPLDAGVRMKVLIVEDHEELSNFLRSALQHDFEITLTENGVEAWKFIKKAIPDLVVSDIMMPKMDGFELCQKIKSTYETSHIPVILLTALTGKAEKLRGMGLGADDYLTKPFDVTLLNQRIKTIVQNRKLVKDKALKMIKLDLQDTKPILENELNDQFVRKMTAVVRSNISNPEFNKNTFAAAMNVSASLLYKKVKALTGQSPTDFIKSIRMDYAVELLQTQHYTITEVSEMSGFSSVGYFSTVFKKYYKKLPTEVLVS